LVGENSAGNEVARSGIFEAFKISEFSRSAKPSGWSNANNATPVGLANHLAPVARRVSANYETGFASGPVTKQNNRGIIDGRCFILHRRLMPRKIALLFSGQGAQKVGMGKDLAGRYAVAANLFGEADALLGRSLSQLAFDGPIEELTKTANCQVALYVHGLALQRAIEEEIGPIPAVAAAGLSLGEFTAHAAAGTFDFATGLKLVAQRSRFMEEACNETNGSMAAFVGGEESLIRQIAAEADIDVANLNAPGQIVLAGESWKVQNAIAIAKETGVRRAVPLTVAGAFHSRLMESAKQRLQTELAAADIGRPHLSVVANVTALPVDDPAEIRATLSNQVTGSVRWAESIGYLLDQIGCDLFLELGPGSVLAGLVSRIRKGIEVVSIENVADLEEALPVIRAAGG
jgi:[acyl-carrier-protein] S-malonyltransferase